MDFFFEDLPCTSEYSPKTDYDDSQRAEGSFDVLKANPSSVDFTGTREQHTSVDDISRKVQDLVEKVNENRNRDQKVMDNFQENVAAKVTEMFQQMKEHMFAVYEENSNAMQVKLQKLSEVLESCTELNKELMGAGQALASLREGLAISCAPEP
ncbi:synaptonemal complex central element protein 2 [Halichoeres trimaculatus]|uniref:synaptonemal complex central element protein 2 n=1 Tax=Halichoeres trimaculatus TaxID=147232 RepID=UPI003D9E933D